MLKLREYRKNLNPEEYLNTEFRQNIRDLNKFISLVGNLTNYYQNLNNQVFVYGKSATVVENETKNFNINDYVIPYGRFENGFYYPELKGTYFIEYGCGFTNDVPNAGTATVSVINQLGQTLTSNVSLVYSGSTPTAVQTSAAFFADFTTDSGVAFKGVSSASGHKIQNLFFKITKVG